MQRKEEDAPKLDVVFAPHDAPKAGEALEALAEFLVSVWLRQRGQEHPLDRAESALPGD